MTTKQSDRDAFEAWLHEQGLDATWNVERNCYEEFPAHFAFKAWQAASSIQAEPQPTGGKRMSELPTQADILFTRREGAKAAQCGQTFRNDCPYTFDKFNGLTHAEFNAFKRPLMDAWFDGWKEWLNVHSLGFDIKPPRQP